MTALRVMSDSSGERLASLTNCSAYLFIASLVEFSSQRVGAKGKWTAGTIAPLVLDLPFGQLDETYKQAIATYLPKLADQGVLFITSSQGEAIEIFEEFANGSLEVISRWISQPYLTNKFEI